MHLRLLCQMGKMNSMSTRVGGMPWPKTGATQYHTQVGLPDGLALGCYQLSPEE